MSIHIHRVESASEFAQLQRVLLEYEHSLESDLRHGPEPTVASVQAAYGDPNAAFLATVDGEPAASVVVTRHDAWSAVLQRLYVKPSHRGRGLARALVGAVVEFARERGYRRVVLDTAPDRLPETYRLYVALGFETCEPYGVVSYEDAVFMELRL